MKVYLVRVSDPEPDVDPFVGVFAANTVFELGLIVDEWLSPMECEYLVVKQGGLYQDAATGVELSERWAELVDDSEDWKPFTQWFNQYHNRLKTA